MKFLPTEKMITCYIRTACVSLDSLRDVTVILSPWTQTPLVLPEQHVIFSAGKKGKNSKGFDIFRHKNLLFFFGESIVIISDVWSRAVTVTPVHLTQTLSVPLDRPVTAAGNI